MRTPGRIVLGLVLLAPLAWAGLHAHYDSWHPCDWLLRDTVERVLRQTGVDPDTASIRLQASTVEDPRVQAVLRRRATPGQCLGTWSAARIFP